MKQKITQCLWYDNGAKEAAALYCSAFTGAKITSQSPIVTTVDIYGQSFTLLDGGPIYHPNPSISFYVTCGTEEEVDHIWKTLSKEGTALMDLGEYPWSKKYGWIGDKFGVTWQIALGKLSDVGQKIIPYIMFVDKQYGRVDEAINYYSSIFKNSKTINVMRYGSNQAPDQEGKVMHAQISLGDQRFMFMESAHQHKFMFNEGVSLIIHCQDQEEIDYYWSRLTESGQESRCGWLKDKFGVSWQILPAMLGQLISNPKAAKAMMEMRKLNIEQLVNAAK